MNTRTTFSVPPETGELLHKLAEHRNLSVAGLVAMLATEAARRDGILKTEYSEGGRKLTVKNDKLGKLSLKVTKCEAKSLAESIERIANEGGWMMDLDVEPPMQVARRGAGMILEQTIEPDAGSGQKYQSIRESMSVATALEIASELRKIAA